MTVKKIEPCEFCKAEPKMHDWGTSYRIECLTEHCPCMPTWIVTTKDEAIEQWNRRVNSRKSLAMIH